MRFPIRSSSITHWIQQCELTPSNPIHPQGATDRWRDGLRRRVLLYQLQAAHPESPLVQAIFEPRGRAGPPRASKADRQQQGQQQGQGAGKDEGGQRGKRRRGWEGGSGSGRGLSLYDGGGSDEDEDYDDGSGGGGTDRRKRPAGSPLGGDGVGGVGGAGAEGVAMGRVMKLGPVAKLRNSSLSLADHRAFQALLRKQQRFEAGAGDARPLTAQERQALAGLEPLVRAERARYLEALQKWVDSGRAPYRPLDKAVGPLVEPFLAQLRARQKGAYPRRYQRHLSAPMGGAGPGQGGGGHGGLLLLPAPAFRETVKTARVPAAGRLRVPALPLDIPCVLFCFVCACSCVCVHVSVGGFVIRMHPPIFRSPTNTTTNNTNTNTHRKDRPLALSAREARRLVERTAALGQEDWVFEDADVLLDLPTLLTLADPTRPWAVPFTVRALGGGGEQQQRRVLIVHRPLLLPVMSMRDRADVFYGQAVPAALRGATAAAAGGAAAAAKEEDEEEGEGETPGMALETWQLAQLRLVLATDRVRLSGPGLTGAAEQEEQEEEEGQEAVLACETDYALEWSEEDEGDQNRDVIRHLLLALLSATARPFLAKVDAKGSKLARVTPRDALGQLPALGRAAEAGRNPAYVSEVVGRVSRVLGVLLGQPEGRFVARQEPGTGGEPGGVGGSMTVYLHVPELEGQPPSESGQGELDLHALIDASGRGDASARSAWRKWLWPSSGADHIPGTFVPRAE